MLKKALLPLFLCSAIVTTILYAVEVQEEEYDSEEIIVKPVKKTKKASSKKKPKKRRASEIRKCKELETLLLGNRFDIKRIAAYLGSNVIGFFAAKAIANKIPQGMGTAYGLLCLLAAITTHYKLLKQYKVSGFPTSTLCVPCSGLYGLPVYAACNYLLLDLQLKNLAQNYDSDEMPECVKAEMDAFVEQYLDEENEADMNMSERVAFSKDILKQIKEEINGKKA